LKSSRALFSATEKKGRQGSPIGTGPREERGLKQVRGKKVGIFELFQRNAEKRRDGK